MLSGSIKSMSDLQNQKSRTLSAVSEWMQSVADIKTATEICMQVSRPVIGYAHSREQEPDLLEQNSSWIYWNGIRAELNSSFH